MQRNFAINLLEVNHKIYEKSEGKITGILLEKSKKKNTKTMTYIF
jgi:hypothetical protein